MKRSDDEESLGEVLDREQGRKLRLLSTTKNSEQVCVFKPPEYKSILFTFDSIQTLLKSHRIGGLHQQKIRVIVVTSILGLLPEGDHKQSDIQYTPENTPSSWLFEYKYIQGRDIITKNLNAGTLKEFINVKKEDMEVFEDIFHNELLDAIKNVEKDLNDDNTDTIDNGLEK